MSDKIRLLERALKEIKGINSLGGFDFNTLLGPLVNQQVDPPTDLALTVISDTQINLAWIDNSASDSFVVQRSLDGLTWSDIATPATNSYNNTGLESYTKYYYRVKSVKGSNESEYSDAANATTLFYATLTATGIGTGVSTLRLQVSENQTLEIISGTARFYTNSSGTLGESTTKAVTTGALRTIYMKAPSGSSVLNIPKPGKVIKWGNSSTDGWRSSTNAANISIEMGKLALTELWITGTSTLIGALPIGLTYLILSGNSINWTYTGALPTGLNYLFLSGSSIAWTYTGALPTGLTTLYLSGNSIAWTYTGALPTKLTYLRLEGDLINWTGLDVGNNGKISALNLENYRIAKMSSADMVTLLTQLTNRTGTLPATITINDYADYASPPQSVTDAVAALKIAKSITTVNLGA